MGKDLWFHRWDGSFKRRNKNTEQELNLELMEQESYVLTEQILVEYLKFTKSNYIPNSFICKLKATHYDHETKFTYNINDKILIIVIWYYYNLSKHKHEIIVTDINDSNTLLDLLNLHNPNGKNSPILNYIPIYEMD